MNVAFLSLGGNLGNRMENMNQAIKTISIECGKIVRMSKVYETEPWGKSSQNRYLNRVIKINTELSAKALLDTLLSIEKRGGRKRDKDQYADRTIDIDILFFNDSVIQLPALQVPHPRAHLRKFILVPLHEIEKGLIHPIFKKDIKTLLSNCEDKLEVHLKNEIFGPNYICIEGNIGSGKTTLAKALQKKWSSQFLPEIYEDNLLLPLFYENPKPYALSMEFSFMINRLHQITKAFHAHGPRIISDYSFYKCLWFAKVNLRASEFSIFEKNFYHLLSLLPQPQLIVYLDTSISNLLNNISKRGRPYEQQMKKNYLQSIELSYKSGLKTLKNVNKLVIPIKNYYAGVESEFIEIIDNYILENFGEKLKKPTFSEFK